jgi:type I restriction enzyme R subunit
LVSLTKDVIEIIKRESQVVDFWENYTKQRDLKSYIILKILLPKLGSNEILFTKRNEIAQKLMELAYHIYRK